MSWYLQKIATIIEYLKKRLAETDVMARLVKGTFWASLSAILTRFFAMISSIIVIRLLGKEGYGEMGMVYSTMAMLGVVAGFGLGSAATKYIAEYRLSDPGRTIRIMRLISLVSLVSGGLMALAAVVISPWLATHILNNSAITPLLQLGALLLFFSQVANVQQGMLFGFELFQESARINLYQGLISPFITVPLVWLLDVTGAILALTLNAALLLLWLTQAVLRERQKIAPNFVEPWPACWRERAVLSRFAIPAMFSQSLVIPVTWLTNTMLVNSPGGYGELGLFNAANQWRQIIDFVPTLLSAALLPIFSQTSSLPDQADFRRMVSINLRLICVITLPPTVLLITLNQPLAAVLGKQFYAAAPIIPVLMFSCFLTVINGPVGNALSGAGRMWTGMIMNSGWAAVLLASAWLLIPWYGGLGLALGYLIAYLCHTVWQMAYVELKLAPEAITANHRLFIFSILLISVSIIIALKEKYIYVLPIVMIIFSLIPFILIIRSYYKTLFPIENKE